MRFDWDAAKNAANIRKHDVAFHDSARVFDDPDRLELDVTEDDYGEVRWETIGRPDLARHFLLSVIFTERFPDTLRIISARKADPDDIRTYDAQFPTD